MILRILLTFIIFIYSDKIIKGQSTNWYLQATAGIELSHYKSPFNIKEDSFVSASGEDHSSGFNYQIGGIIGRSINHFISFESGLHLLIREDKNIDRTFACDTLEGSRRCVGLSQSIEKKRYHIFEIPIRIRLQKNFSKKHKTYWTGAYSNYLYYATIYDSGSFENILNRKYYAFSFNTSIGWEYQIHPKWRIGLDVNTRLFEQRQKDEVRFLFDQEEKNFNEHFDNINVGIICKYRIF